MFSEFFNYPTKRNGWGKRTGRAAFAKVSHFFWTFCVFLSLIHGIPQTDRNTALEIVRVGVHTDPGMSISHQLAGGSHVEPNHALFLVTSCQNTGFLCWCLHYHPPPEPVNDGETLGTTWLNWALCLVDCV